MSRSLLAVAALGCFASMASADVSVAAKRRAPGGAPWLVLDGRLMLDEPVEETWSGDDDEKERIDGRDDVVVRAPVEEKRLPARVRAWKGRKLRLGDERGEACVGEVDGFEIVVRGVDIDGSESSLTSLTWWDTGGAKFLAATLKTPAGCRNPRWAWPAEEPAPPVVRSREPGRALARLALERLAGSEVYRRAHRRFDEDLADATDQRPRLNDGWQDEDVRSLRLGVLRVRGATLVWASLRREAIAHGGDHYDVWALFRVDGGALTELASSEIFVGSLMAVGDTLVFDQAGVGSDFGVLRGPRYANAAINRAGLVHGMP